jgi:hypothetical protein
MIEAPAGSGAQWASFWASLAFELNHPGLEFRQVSSVAPRPVPFHHRARCASASFSPRNRDHAGGGVARADRTYRVEVVTDAASAAKPWLRRGRADGADRNPGSRQGRLRGLMTCFDAS